MHDFMLHFFKNALKALIDQSESLGEEAIPLNVVRSLFEAKNKRFVDQNLEEHKGKVIRN